VLLEVLRETCLETSRSLFVTVDIVIEVLVDRGEDPHSAVQDAGDAGELARATMDSGAFV
jgi:hypothetical protein